MMEMYESQSPVNENYLHKRSTITTFMLKYLCVNIALIFNVIYFCYFPLQMRALVCLAAVLVVLVAIQSVSARPHWGGRRGRGRRHLPICSMTLTSGLPACGQTPSCPSFASCITPNQLLPNVTAKLTNLTTQLSVQLSSVRACLGQVGLHTQNYLNIEKKQCLRCKNLSFHVN